MRTAVAGDELPDRETIAEIEAIFSSRPLIYIAGPYTNPDPVTNTRTAVEAGLRIFEATGSPVVVPHLSLLAHAMFPRDVDYWYRFDLAQVAKCDALLRLPGDSTGADREVAFAAANSLRVFADEARLLHWIAEIEGRS